MEPDDVFRLIRQGEGERLDFKRAEVSAATLAEVFAAFANHCGGIVLVGVSDRGQILGVSDRSALEEKIRNAALNNCRPEIRVETEWVEMPDGATVALVHVPEGETKPYQANKIYYVRDGSRCRPATPPELARMLAQGGHLVFDSTAVPGARFEDLDPERVERYVQHRRRSPRLKGNARSAPEFLRATGLLAPDGTPTVAAVLFFAPYPQRFLPQATLNAIRFVGTAVDNRQIVDRERIEGSVEEIIEGGVAFILRNSRTLSVIEGIYRRDLPEYPEGAIREVLTNAVVHRDYFSREWITLWMFDDRLEVENPGGLLGGLSIEDLLSRPRSYPRNPLLLRVAQDLGLVEVAGSGILRIFQDMREHGAPDPIFEADEAHFKVTLPSLWWYRKQEEMQEEI